MTDLELQWGQLFRQEGMQIGSRITVNRRCDNICTCAHECWVNNECIYAIIILRRHDEHKNYIFKHLDLYRQWMNGHLKMNTKQGNEIHFWNIRLHAWNTSPGLFPFLTSSSYTYKNTYLNPETNSGHCGKWIQDCTGYIKKNLLTNTSRQRETGTREYPKWQCDS